MPRVAPDNLGEESAGSGEGRRRREWRAERRFGPLPGQISTLGELDAGWDILLQTATRAAANFPVASR